MLDQALAPVAAPANDGAAVRISSVRWMTALRVKSWRPEHRRGDEPIAIAGLTLPRRAGATLSGPVRVLCLAPAEWLVLSHQSSAPLLSQLQPALHEHGLAFTDASEGFATWGVEGPMTRTLLSKGCGLDFDLHAFPPGRCARTRFAQVAAVLHCLDESKFELAVARSYSSYLHEWLTDAAVEWTP